MPRRFAFALLLTLLACSPAATQEAPAAAPAPGTSFEQEFVERTARDAIAALAKGAGVRLEQPVPVVLLTAKQAKARRAAFAETLPEGAGVTQGMDLLADFMFSDSMLGRYLPDE